jgi:hypothetical protein
MKKNKYLFITITLMLSSLHIDGTQGWFFGTQSSKVPQKQNTTKSIKKPSTDSVTSGYQQTNDVNQGLLIDTSTIESRVQPLESPQSYGIASKIYKLTRRGTKSALNSMVGAKNALERSVNQEKNAQHISGIRIPRLNKEINQLNKNIKFHEDSLKKDLTILNSNEDAPQGKTLLKSGIEQEQIILANLKKNKAILETELADLKKELERLSPAQPLPINSAQPQSLSLKDQKLTSVISPKHKQLPMSNIFNTSTSDISNSQEAAA